MATCKEDDRQSHQIGIKAVPHFLATKGIGLSSDI